MKVLITGGAGFIGSHLIDEWLQLSPSDTVLNIDKLGYASSTENLREAEKNPHYLFQKVDLADRYSVKRVLNDFKPEAVVHLAAESHVDNSIQDPGPFIQSNIVGTFNLLEELRQLWKNSSSHRFHHVSTDEVYGALGETGFFKETTAYDPKSPYSASKAASDHLVCAYVNTYKLNAVITNCSNNFGPRQHAEKLIPTVIRSALCGKPIPIYGKGNNVRDWLYVKDHCQAIVKVFQKGKTGERYNIGAQNEKTNLELVGMICNHLNELVGKGPGGDYKNLIQFVTDRAGHDYRYAIDSTKMTQEMGWKSQFSFQDALKNTVKWYAGAQGKGA